MMETCKKIEMLPACNPERTMSKPSLSWEMSHPVTNLRSGASFSLDICALYPSLPFFGGGLKCKIPLDWLQWIQITCQSGCDESLLWRLKKRGGNGTQFGLWICSWHTADLVLLDYQLSSKATIEIFFAAPFHASWGKVFILQPSWVTSQPGCLHRGRPYYASVACLPNSRTSAGFLLFVYLWFILAEPL